MPLISDFAGTSPFNLNLCLLGKHGPSLSRINLKCVAGQRLTTNRNRSKHAPHKNMKQFLLFLAAN